MPDARRGVRVPSRVYFVLVLFGLIASLSVLAYVALVVGGYRPPAGAPHELLFPSDPDSVPGQTLFLILAAAFCLSFTGLAIRALVRGAREDAQFRRQRDDLKRELRRRQALEKEGRQGPPGYS